MTMDYITCEKRKNTPKINVLICEKKCQHAKKCKPYLNYLQIQSVKTVLNSGCTSGDKDILPVDNSPERIPQHGVVK